MTTQRQITDEALREDSLYVVDDRGNIIANGGIISVRGGDGVVRINYFSNDLSILQSQGVLYEHCEKKGIPIIEGEMNSSQFIRLNSYIRTIESILERQSKIKRKLLEEGAE